MTMTNEKPTSTGHPQNGPSSTKPQSDGPTVGAVGAIAISPIFWPKSDRSNGSPLPLLSTLPTSGTVTTGTNCDTLRGTLPDSSPAPKDSSPTTTPGESPATIESRRYEQQRAIRNEQIKRSFRYSGLPKRHIEQSYNLSRPAGWTTALDKVTRVILRDGMAALIGTPGSGKTQIAVEVTKAYLRATSTIGNVRYEVLSDAYGFIREAYGPGALRTEMSVIGDFTFPRLLILDEIDKPAGSAAEQRLLHRILDKRYRNCLPTLLIGNCPDNESLAKLLDGTDGIGPLSDRLRQTGGIVEAFGWNFRRDQS